MAWTSGHTPNGGPALRAEGVSVSYGAVTAVRDVSFDVERGDYFCIVGGNGSGKSSLLRALLGIVPVSGGGIRFGVPRDRVAYCPQSSSIERDFPASVWEIVLTGRLSPRKRSLFYGALDKRAAASVLEELEIYEIRDRRIGELSGGQLQRALIARALCGEPELLVLDEPDAGLDALSADILRGALAGRNAAHGLTILMATHNLADVERDAKRVAVMNGCMEFCGSTVAWRERWRQAVSG